MEAGTSGSGIFVPENIFFVFVNFCLDAAPHEPELEPKAAECN
jgi:hypothetical protein